jgi:4'-phosphopantetheinyl transferase
MDCDEGLRRFVVSHGALRTILGRYLDQKPEHVRLVTHAGGKPRLAAPADISTICFSLSHSDEFALCAVTKDRDVGVDVEHVRPLSVWREIAARYFSPHEREALRDVPPARALETFFRYWTCKEAYSKALGQGVSRRWTQFSVFPVPGAVVEPSHDRIAVEDDDRFTLCPLEPDRGYVAAVAVRGVDWYLCCWRLHFE